MIKINEKFLELQDSYLFGTIVNKVAKYSEENPDAKIIKLGVGDVTRPIPQVILDAMHKAVEEMGDAKTFKGYGPEIGYDFLKEKNIDFVVNTQTKKYHFEDCSILKNVDPKYLVDITTKEKSLIKDGYSNCKICDEHGKNG